ncbi:MAG: cytochrome c [Neptuniibacter sp.]
MRCLINPFVKVLVLAMYLVGCSAMAVAPPADTGSKKKKKAEETPEMVAEAKAKVFSREEISIANGEKRFNQTCVYCHGHQGSGGKARKLQGRELDPDYLFKTITRGKKRGSLIMPPWKRSFNAEQRWELVTYIMSLSEMK